MIWGHSDLCNVRARCDSPAKSSGLDQQSREQPQKYIKISDARGFVQVCFNVRQRRVSVLHAESDIGPCNSTQRHKGQNQRHKENFFAPSLRSSRLCVKLFLQVRVDEFEDFCGVKWFCEGTDRAESFRFVKNLRCPVSGDEKNRNLRLQVEKI